MTCNRVGARAAADEKNRFVIRTPVFFWSSGLGDGN